LSGSVFSWAQRVPRKSPAATIVTSVRSNLTDLNTDEPRPFVKLTK
jgi:hypothetical protein